METINRDLRNWDLRELKTLLRLTEALAQPEIARKRREQELAADFADATDTDKKRQWIQEAEAGARKYCERVNRSPQAISLTQEEEELKPAVAEYLRRTNQNMRKAQVR